MNLQQSEITIITQLKDHQLAQLTALYRNEFWCNKREINGVGIMLENSDIIIGAEDQLQNLVGFVRVLTDYVYKAIIFDLIIDPKWRGKKTGSLLMDTIIKHPELQNVEHFDLNCLPEMHLYYKKWNFTNEFGELGFMRRSNVIEEVVK